MISHKNGMKHLKKEAAERQRRIKAENEAGLSSEPERAIKLIDNPRPVPKKVPVSLSEKLRESRDSILLNFNRPFNRIFNTA